MLLGALTLGKAPIICAVAEKSIENQKINAALRAGANMLEIRVDTFSKFEIKKLPTALKRLKARKIPLLLTIRSSRENGKNGTEGMTDSERLALFVEFIELFDAVDIELSSKKILKKVISAAKEKKKLVIVSFHNFKSTPSAKSLAKTINEARRAGADIVKLAATTKGKAELNRLTSLLACDKNLIVIAMGAVGKPSRVFFPMLGSLITYAGISGANAPGQLSIAKLKSEFRLYAVK